MSAIHITDIESAINHWRAVKPSPDGVTLASELRALAEVYALMIYHHQEEAAEKAFRPKLMPHGKLGMTARLIHPASRFAQPAKATRYAKAVVVPSKRCSAGLN